MSEKDRVVVITGAGGGMGSIAAHAFAASGNRLVLADLALDRLEEVAAELRAIHTGAEILTIPLNIADEESVAAAAASVRAWAGRVDVLANIAGTEQSGTAVVDMTTAEWDRVHNINLRGLFFMCRAFVPLMPHHSNAAIVNIASWWGRRAHGLYSAYCTSKAGVIFFTQSLAMELAELGIRVNAVAPGNINTRMLQSVMKKYAQELGMSYEELMAEENSKIPLHKPGEPEDIVDAIEFLSSDRASYITGATLDVNGGVALT
ncbi:SDR family NAD(P)-dependent oxidoreductase [Arthrobacter sp. S39]|uniref:SDR family NAD(P)-dependent oxidoreductase n=1 Tax=Arthrobacter sp. S39 TaxID=2509720 RepID=UPI0013EF6FE6|nr:SDR family NAD(P)-dependent oxidoreductase [Arthrobacter sp. S39]